MKDSKTARTTQGASATTDAAGTYCAKSAASMTSFPSQERLGDLSQCACRTRKRAEGPWQYIRDRTLALDKAAARDGKGASAAPAQHKSAETYGYWDQAFGASATGPQSLVPNASVQSSGEMQGSTPIGVPRNHPGLQKAATHRHGVRLVREKKSL